MTKLAIVTGAGRGISEAIAKRLSSDGFSIAVVDIDGKNAKKVAQQINQNGGNAKDYNIDVSDRDSVFATVNQAVKDLGELFAYINNAGVAFIDSILDSSPSDIKRLLDVNLLGTYWGIQAAGTQFKKQKSGGRIVNAASLAGVEASALQSAYSASKFGIRGLTQAASKEFAKDQITVNAYDPGVVRTQLRDNIDKKTSKIKGISVEQQQKDVLKEISLGREATPEDVANVVSWYVSSQASYITGQSMLIDGGMHFS